LQADNESLSNRITTVGDSKTLTDEQFNELLKLRGEVGVLRRQTNELGNLVDENRNLRAELNNNMQIQMSNSLVTLYAEQQSNTVETLKILALDFKVYAADHNDQYPTNFDQWIQSSSRFVFTNFPGGTGLDNFEFVNAGLVNASTPDKIMLRERFPRKNPQGKWQRVYSLASGSVRIRTSDDGNFDAFEQQHMVSPTNQ
jgi:hypothetical protein